MSITRDIITANGPLGYTALQFVLDQLVAYQRATRHIEFQLGQGKVYHYYRVEDRSR